MVVAYVNIRKQEMNNQGKKRWEEGQNGVNPTWRSILILLLSHKKAMTWLKSVKTFLVETKIIFGAVKATQIWVCKYRKVASSNTSRLEAHAGFFRLLMKEILGPYVL